MGDGARELAWRGIAAELRGFRVGGAEQLAAGRDIGVAVCVAAGVGRAAGRSEKTVAKATMATRTDVRLRRVVRECIRLPYLSAIGLGQGGIRTVDAR
ncbi:hypothetical protein EN35_07425 [Rhodococcus qingshengii]|nr:hypothetical protein EN35_07425 [Rhodococcus qingshengii]